MSQVLQLSVGLGKKHTAKTTLVSATVVGGVGVPHLASRAEIVRSP